MPAHPHTFAGGADDVGHTQHEELKRNAYFKDPKEVDPVAQAVWARALVCCLVGMAIAAASPSAASGALIGQGCTAGKQWTTIPDGYPTQPNAHVQDFYDVAAISEQDAWAVGTYVNEATGADYPLAEHWNGQLWRYVDTPVIPSGSGFGAVAALASDDVWAVGGYLDGSSGTVRLRTLAEHFDGRAWTRIPTKDPTEFVAFADVSGVAPDDVWAVGYQIIGDHHKTVTEHWNGRAWSVVPSPSYSRGHQNLWSVSAVSRNDVWAVGQSRRGKTGTSLIEHWDGRAWTIVPGPLPGSGSGLFSIAALSSTDVWAVGGYFESTGGPELALTQHWDGTRWTVVPAHSPGTKATVLGGVASVSHKQVWAVGLYDLSNAARTLTERWDGQRWRVVPSPNLPTTGGGGNVLLSVAAIPNGGGLWAVGGFYNETAPSEGLIERYGCPSSPVGSTTTKTDQGGIPTTGAARRADHGSEVWDPTCDHMDDRADALLDRIGGTRIRPDCVLG